MNQEHSKYHIHESIAEAKTIDTRFYLDPNEFRRSRELIFARCWQFVGDIDQIGENGWVTPVNLLPGMLDEPLILTRDKSGNNNCLSNVCTHRGNLLVEKPCRLNDMRCKYHGRRFHLDGKFMSMPEFKEVKNFPSEADNLHRLPLHALGKWLFTRLEQGPEADDFFGDMARRLSWMDFNKFRFRPELSRDYKVDAHWALYCENYLEGFHIPFVHAGLNAVIDYGNYTTELFRYSNLQLGIAKEGEMCFELPEASPDYGKKVGGYYFWVFPNMMFNFYPWGLSVNIVKPTGVSSCTVSFLTYVMDEDKLRQGIGADLHQVEMEDEDVVQLVQRGIRSRFYKHGRYSVTRETGTHHFHRLIAEFMEQEF